MDIYNAYIHEEAMNAKPVNLNESRNSNGTYTHGGAIGILQLNLWGGKSAGLYFMKGLM